MQKRISVSRFNIYGWLGLLIVVGLYIRSQPPYYSYTYSNDEFLVLSIAKGRSFAEVMHYALYDLHPPLFYILLHYWMLISTAPPFVRCLPLFFGIALIPIHYLIGKRMGGELCGLICATLVAFSYGSIIQSYLIRDYSLMLFNLSLNFYYYLGWRDTHKRSALIGYIFWGWLGLLSHFFSIFYFFSVALFETGCLLHKRMGRQTISEWIIANLAIAALFALLWHFWEPTLSFFRKEFSWHHSDGTQLILTTLSAPIAAANYIYPAIPALFFILLFYICSPKVAILRPTNLHPYLILAVIACAMSMIIYLAHFLNAVGTRHCLWMLLLLLPVTGLILTGTIEQITQSSGNFPVRGVLLVVLFSVFCDIVERPLDQEYNGLQRGAWKAMTHTLDGLGPRDVIVTDKDGLNMLSGMQMYKTDDTFMNTLMLAFAPYQETHILLNSDYFGRYGTKALQTMLSQAEAGHFLDNIDKIVFVKMWSKWPFFDLVQCQSLRKTFLYPPLTSEAELNRSNFHPGNLVVMEVSKQEFIDEVLSDSGKAHSCLDEKQDKADNWYYIPMTAKHPTHSPKE